MPRLQYKVSLTLTELVFLEERAVQRNKSVSSIIAELVQAEMRGAAMNETAPLAWDQLTVNGTTERLITEHNGQYHYAITKGIISAAEVARIVENANIERGRSARIAAGYHRPFR